MDNPNSDQTPGPNSSTPVPENSNASEDTSAPTTTETCGKEHEKEEDDRDILRQPKRRKNCPSALDEFDSFNSAMSLGFSFSFDSKFGSGCSTPEVTPKFGSFNRVKPSSGKDPKSEEIVLKEEDEEEEEEVEKSDVILLSSIDGIRTVD